MGTWSVAVDENPEMLEYLTWLRAQNFSASAFRLEIQRKQDELRRRGEHDKEPE